ncbi:MAG: hypothetical protein ACM34K_09290 [Bacillota bacterium]
MIIRLFRGEPAYQMINRLLYIYIFLLVSCLSHFAQISPGARQISLSNSDVALSDDVFSVFTNPSGLAQMNWREIGIYYSPSPFGMKELANAYLCYHEPSAIGSFGLGLMTYGFELYRENHITMAYSNNYKDFYFGLSAKLNLITIKGYGSTSAILFNIGGLVYLSDDIKWGVNAQNISHATIGNEKGQLPYGFNTGISYLPADEVSINIATEKAESFQYSFKLGLEYNLLKYIYLRSGFSTDPDRFSAGLGINYSFIEFDYSIFTHLELGLTHQAGIIIHFSDDEPRAAKIKSKRSRM